MQQHAEELVDCDEDLLEGLKGEEFHGQPFFRGVFQVGATGEKRPPAGWSRRLLSWRFYKLYSLCAPTTLHQMNRGVPRVNVNS